ncbi:MAG: SusD/RagB family nutrient-binding outer membrane lipoprotein [Chitinophagaceae bacterium]|nr:SusD/RagB family nutrient-binding outer membrane lipoprotein [Chitinophagaceae bacterium]
MLININNLKKAAAFTLLIAGAVSCGKIKDFGSTNVNPAATTEPITSALLTNIEVGLSARVYDNTSQMFVQYFSEAEYPGAQLYAIPQIDFAGTYSASLYDAKNILNKSTSDVEKAAVRILKAYIFSTITDRWGDVPYSEALNGVIPKYDTQESIYKDLLKELSEAAVQLDGGGAIKGDIMYNGVTSSWKKLANTLRMRLALNLAKRYPAASEYAAQQFSAAYTAGGITTNADNFKLAYPGNAFRNPYYETNLQLRDDGYSDRMYNLLSSFGDARNGVYGSSAVPVPYGLSEGQINTWRQANPGWARQFADAHRTETSPLYVATAAETLLAAAEAADRGWISASPSALLQAGVNASFAQWNLAAPSASYFSQTGVAISNPVGTGANLKAIATQRYIAYYPDGIQGWNVWRATGFPVLTPTIAANCLSASHTTIPRRYTYGTGEYSLNPAGVAAANAGSQGADVQESRVCGINNKILIFRMKFTFILNILIK